MWRVFDSLACALLGLDGCNAATRVRDSKSGTLKAKDVLYEGTVLLLYRFLFQSFRLRCCQDEALSFCQNPVVIAAGGCISARYSNYEWSCLWTCGNKQDWCDGIPGHPIRCSD